MAPDGKGIGFETFRGDLDGLHDMALAAWRDEYGRASFPDYYAPELARYFIGSACPEDHLRAAYEGDRCVAFVANLPRVVRFHGRTCRAVLSAMLVSSREHLRRGIAEGMIRQALELRARYGYDLALFYLETGHRSSELFEKLRREGHRLVRLKGLWPMARILDLERARFSEGLGRAEVLALRALRAASAPKAVALDGIRAWRPADAAASAELLNRQAERCDLARIASAAEVERAFGAESVSRALVAEVDGEARGLMQWVKMVHQGARPEPWAWVHHTALSGLPRRLRRRLVAGFVSQARAEGCVGAIAWRFGYHPTGPLWANHFIAYPRGIAMWAWLFNDGLPAARCRRVFELQV
jgi:hypothetical protein